MYIHSYSRSKSFGGASFYESNQALNTMLCEKKKIHDMKEKGYIFINQNISTFAALLDKKYTRYDFTVGNHHKNLRNSVVRNDKLKRMVCIYGKKVESVCLKNGFAFKYKKYINLTGEFKYVYVMTDQDLNIVYEYWIY